MRPFPPSKCVRPWDARGSVTNCVWCHTLFSNEDVLSNNRCFTVVPPWRDWRPIRLVCGPCMSDTETWDHLSLIDSLYLGVMEVRVPEPWLSSTTLRGRSMDDSMDSRMGEPTPTYRLYSSTVGDRARSVWLRLVQYRGEPTVCVHVVEGAGFVCMEAISVESLQRWNPELPPLQFEFARVCRPNFELLMERTVDASRHWWLLLVSWMRGTVGCAAEKSGECVSDAGLDGLPVGSPHF